MRPHVELNDLEHPKILMQTYNGTHGTSLRRAQNIQEEGFRPTKVGRAGRGVYFWHYYAAPDIAIQLARGWFEFARRQNEYNDEASPECAVIFGSVTVADEDVLDCTTGEVIEEIALSLQNLESVKDTDIHSAYERVVSEVEKALGRPITVVKANVTQPAKMAFALKNVIGNPPIFVVRERQEEIKIEVSS